MTRLTLIPLDDTVVFPGMPVTLALDAGQTIAEGTPDEIVRNPAVEKAYLGA